MEAWQSLVDCSGLENRQPFTRFRGSNPLASAFFLNSKMNLNFPKIIIILFLSFFLMQCSDSKLSEKTIVAWVSLTDSYNMEGSLITIQDGETFDGIFLSSKDGFKWYAGSENDNRSCLLYTSPSPRD